MNGYGDPRREAYFTKTTVSPDYEYLGVRSGIRVSQPVCSPPIPQSK